MGHAMVKDDKGGGLLGRVYACPCTCVGLLSTSSYLVRKW